MNTLRNFAKSIFAHIFAKFEYFEKVIICSKSPGPSALKLYICSHFKSFKVFRTAIPEPLRCHFAKIAHKKMNPTRC